jgi:hypothetical protein
VPIGNASFEIGQVKLRFNVTMLLSVAGLQQGADLKSDHLQVFSVYAMSMIDMYLVALSGL